MSNKSDFDLSSSRLALILLGASRFDDYENHTSFETSKEAFRKTLVGQGVSVFPGQIPCCDLFNVTTPFIDKLVAFLNETMKSCTDILFYYCGHGDLNDNKDFVFVLPNTNHNLLKSTGMPAAYLRELQKEYLPTKRVFLFLDCCYARQAVREWVSGSPVGGTAIAWAADRGATARAPRNEEYTMFTGSFLKALKKGTHANQPDFSFDKAIELTKGIINNTYDKQARVLPGIDNPDQPGGNDISKLPFFVNPAFDPTIADQSRKDKIEYSSKNRPFSSSRKIIFNDHTITVTLSLKKLQLYIDGNLCASIPTQNEPDPKKVLLASSFLDDGQRHTIKVYGQSSAFQGKLKLSLDDRVFGDAFDGC